MQLDPEYYKLWCNLSMEKQRLRDSDWIIQKGTKKEVPICWYQRVILKVWKDDVTACRSSTERRDGT